MGRRPLTEEEREQRREKKREKAKERENKRGVHSLRKALEEIAKIPAPVVTQSGRKAYAIIYSKRYQEAVNYLVNHYNDGSLALLNPQSVEHKPFNYTGSDKDTCNRERAKRFMMFDEGGTVK